MWQQSYCEGPGRQVHTTRAGTCHPKNTAFAQTHRQTNAPTTVIPAVIPANAGTQRARATGPAPESPHSPPIHPGCANVPFAKHWGSAKRPPREAQAPKGRTREAKRPVGGDRAPLRSAAMRKKTVGAAGLPPLAGEMSEGQRGHKAISTDVQTSPSRSPSTQRQDAGSEATRRG